MVIEIRGALNNRLISVLYKNKNKTHMFRQLDFWLLCSSIWFVNPKALVTITVNWEFYEKLIFLWGIVFPWRLILHNCGEQVCSRIIYLTTGSLFDLVLHRRLKTFLHSSSCVKQTHCKSKIISYLSSVYFSPRLK